MDLGVAHGESGIELGLGSEAIYSVLPNISEGWLPYTVFAGL